MRPLSRTVAAIAMLVALGAAVIPTASAAITAAPASEQKLDSALATREAASPLLYYDAGYLRTEGKGWQDTPTSFSRLPARAKKYTPARVWELGGNTAGICTRFVTDSTTIAAVWDGSGEGMYHMARTGSGGLDLYRREGRRWVYLATGRPQTTRTVSIVAKGLPGKPTEYLMYLPLYHDVKELKIGVAPDAFLAPAVPRKKAKPIVFYGTSITQGGCASRAGMCHVALLGRWLDREAINLGFSGSGKMEPELATLFAELDAEVFVLECLPNMTLEAVKERVGPFARVLREKRPDMPILLVENPINPGTDPQNMALREVYRTLKKSGVAGLHYLASEGQFPTDENGTVDGVHPTDLGFYNMAKTYRPVLQSLLRNR